MLLICFGLLAVFFEVESTTTPPVSISDGVLHGAELEEAYAFFSVPFGKPPVDELRFRNPVANDAYGELDVSIETGVGCIGIPAMCGIGQCATYKSEDCLYLNVFVPKSIDLSAVELEATTDVLVWFHGGSFWMGAATAPLYDGRYLANVTNSIIVSPNYRYLPFGFLAMNDVDAPKGNMGFRDQLLALQWVQENIASFGGNKISVTIFGESGGAQSVSLHLMHEESDALFQQGIIDSNPVSFMFKNLEEAEDLGTKLARRSGCTSGTWECLKDLPTMDIVKGFLQVMVANMFLRRDLYGFLEPFAPIIDETTFSQQPIDAFIDGNWQRGKNFIIGTNSQELYLVSSMIPFPIDYKTYLVISQIFWTDISGQVNSIYAPDRTLPDYRDTIGDQLSHFAFTCSSRALARGAVNTKDVDTDVFYYRNYHPLGEPDCDNMLGQADPICGTCYHSSELSFVWRTGPLINQTYRFDEKPYINAWSSYIGNFITSGNPNFGLSIKDQEELGRFSTWNKYTNEGDWSSIGLDAPEPYEENDIIKEYCDFWDGIGYDFILLPQNVAKLIDRLNKLHSENFDWDKLTVDDFAITF